MEPTLPDVRSQAKPPGEDVAAAADVDVSARTMGAISAVDLSLSAGLPARIGNFIVLDRLGSGGMGVVFAAYDTRLDRKVAVKLLHQRFDASSQGTGRLLREAQAMARVSHPNVAPIYEVGEHAGRVFVAMELIDGPTLRVWQEAEARAPAAILDLYIQAGRGLQAAHEAGLVHRDFKPDNVLVGGDGRVRVVDFGLARAQAVVRSPEEAAITASEGPSELGDVVGEETQAGALVGTPAYMSPEQFCGGVVDARSDLFAFSIALYEALVGERPFVGDGLVQLMTNVTAGALRPLPPGVEVPAALLAALRRGLEADPARRWPAMAALLDELERSRGGDPSAAPRLRRRIGVVILASTVVVTGFLNYRAFAGRSAVSHLELIGAVLSGVVVVAAIGVFARKTLESNAYHRRVYLLLVLIVGQLFAFRVVAALADLDLERTYLLDLLGIAAVTGSAAVFALRWFGWLALTTFAGALAMLLAREHALVAYNIGYSGSVLLLIVLWSRAAGAAHPRG